MSLDLRAIIRNGFVFNPYEEWNEPDEDDFVYRNDKAAYDRDIEEYERLCNEYDNSIKEVDSFHIGYGGFKVLRERLATALGYEFFTKSNSNSPFPDYCLRWPDDAVPEVKAFLLHIDCDGEFSKEEVKVLAEEMKKSDKVKTLCGIDETTNRFYDFVQKSAAERCEWDFC